MDSKKVLYSTKPTDEYRTPVVGVLPVLKYIKNKSIIWCPFDKDDSNFVLEFKKAGFDVINTHIDYGYDFYKYQSDKFDLIISNPPFSNKRLIFERALKFDKPFALLMSNTWLNDSAPKQLFKDKDLQLLMFEERIKYKDINGNVSNKITFSSSYYCYNFLDKQLVMDSLKNYK